MNYIAFTIRGRLVSNNRVTRHVGRLAIKSGEAREDEARVRTLAFAVAVKTGWKPPEAAALYITAWNTRKDVDNVSKIISDGLQGPVLRNDRDLVALGVKLDWDSGGERYDITVIPRPDHPQASAHA